MLYEIIRIVAVLVFGVACAQGATWYIKPNNITAANCSLCETLDSAVKDIRNSSVKNLNVIFLPGNHILSSFWNVSDMNEVSFKVRMGNTTVTCASTAEASIHFSNITKLSLHSISLQNCNGKFIGHIKAALYVNNVSIVAMVAVSIHRCCGYGLYINRSSTIHLENCNFSRNFGSDYYEGGNTKIVFKRIEKGFTKIIGTYFTHGIASDINGHHAAGIYVSFLGSNVTMTIKSCYIWNNTGRNAVFEVQNLNFTTETSVSIIDTQVLSGRDIKFAGLSYYILPIPHFTNVFSPFIANILVISNSYFAYNEAEESTSSLYIDIHDSGGTSSHVRISKCNFTNNYIKTNSSTGAVLQFMRHPIPKVPYVFSIERYSSISVQYNTVLLQDNNFVENKGLSTKVAVVKIINSDNLEFSNCNFLNNIGTALSLHSSSVVFSEHVIFRENVAIYGAAIQFCGASLFYIKRHTKIEFKNNSATQKGGAIYVKGACLDRDDNCFFQPVVSFPINIDNFQSETNMSIEFKNNTSGIGGDDVYGGNVDNCYTYETFKSLHMQNYYCSGKIFDALTSTNKNLSISSDPYTLIFCNPSTEYGIESWPGNMFQVCLQPIGQRHSPTFGSIEVISTAILVSSIVPRLYSNDSSEIMNITIFSNLTHVTATLSFKLQRYSLIENENLTTLDVYIRDCPWGYSLNTTTGQCEMIILFKSHSCAPTSDYKITCTNHWIGCINDSCSSNADGIVLRCFEYCQESIVSTSNISDQCVAGRVGLGCSQCISSYSAVLGTSRCKLCSNSHFWLIVIYLLSGAILITILSKFDITVTSGTLNGIIFYANVIHINETVFFPIEFSKTNVIRVALSWINLDLGIEVCFYKGMTTYQKIWLQYGYIIYLWLLQLVIVFLCRKYVSFTRFCGKNVTKVLATIILLSYMKSLQVIANSVACTHLYSMNSRKRVWKLDPSIKLGSVKLTLLIIAGTLLGLVLIGFAICLFSLQILKKASNRKVLTWVSKFQPFFEAFTGPCNYNYTFWPGFLFMVRIFFVTVLTLQDFKHYNYNRTGTCCSFAALIIVCSFIFPSGVYKKWSLNVLELSILVNLALLSGIVTFKHASSNPESIQYLTCTSVLFVVISCFCYKVKSIYKFIRKNCHLILQKFAHAFFQLTEQSRVIKHSTSRTDRITHSEFHVSIPPNEASQLLNVSNSLHSNS